MYFITFRSQEVTNLTCQDLKVGGAFSLLMMCNIGKLGLFHVFRQMQFFIVIWDFFDKYFKPFFNLQLKSPSKKSNLSWV
jgi:hypothetical protein